MPTIVILGWGSLLWDDNHKEQKAFNDQIDDWQFDGPELKIEFSRISSTRKGALTLVVDPDNGSTFSVAYARSKRTAPQEAIEDLMRREGITRMEAIGCYCFDESQSRSRNDATRAAVKTWAQAKGIDVVVWTDLSPNFSRENISRLPFTVENAIQYLRALRPEGQKAAVEYVRKAPEFVVTPLRSALEGQGWLGKYGG